MYIHVLCLKLDLRKGVTEVASGITVVTAGLGVTVTEVDGISKRVDVIVAWVGDGVGVGLGKGLQPHLLILSAIDSLVAGQDL